MPATPGPPSQEAGCGDRDPQKANQKQTTPSCERLVSFLDDLGSDNQDAVVQAFCCVWYCRSSMRRRAERLYLMAVPPGQDHCEEALVIEQECRAAAVVVIQHACRCRLQMAAGSPPSGLPTAEHSGLSTAEVPSTLPTAEVMAWAAQQQPRRPRGGKQRKIMSCSIILALRHLPPSSSRRGSSCRPGAPLFCE